jgi:hypothetical protein
VARSTCPCWQLLAIVIATSAGSACTQRPSEIADQLAARQALGVWLSVTQTTDGPVTIDEREQWQLAIDSEQPNAIAGTVIRIVDITNTNAEPFRCNGKSSYRLVSRYQLHADKLSLPLQLSEQLISTDDSPCERGFRQTTDYTVDLVGSKLHATWSDGSQELVRSGPTTPLNVWQPPMPPVDNLEGQWISSVSSVDETGRNRQETETWEFSWSPGNPTLGASYRRVVEISDVGHIIACAGSSSYAFAEYAVLEGKVVDANSAGGRRVFTVKELATSRSDHPCTTPGNSADGTQPLNEATVELRGDYLVLEWRGKRRQVLYR